MTNQRARNKKVGEEQPSSKGLPRSEDGIPTMGGASARLQHTSGGRVEEEPQVGAQSNSENEDSQNHHGSSDQEMGSRMARMERMMEHLMRTTSCRSAGDHMDNLEENLSMRGNLGFGTYKPIQPKSYTGERDSLVLERWIRESEKFLAQSKIEYVNWVSIGSSFLEGPAYNWFMREERAGRCHSWESFKAEIKAYFVPDNEQSRLLDEWRNLRQGEGRLKDYIEKYRQLTLQIEGLSPALLLHGFLFGLRNRIKGEIERKSPSTMDEAMKLAEKSGDLDWNTYGSKYGSWDSKGDYRKSSTPNNSSSGVLPRFSTVSPPTTSLGKSSGYTSGTGNNLLRRRCFECGGPHLVSACPKRKNTGIKAAAMQAGIGNLEPSLEDLEDETEMAVED